MLAMSRVIRDRASKRTIVARTGYKFWLDDRRHQNTGSREHIGFGVVVGRRRFGKSIGCLVVMLSMCV